MKHVAPNETEQSLDLGKPSLEALSFMLRHREMWPAGFEWNYYDCYTCAIGMAKTLWDVQNKHLYSCLPVTMFDMVENDGDEIFFEADKKRGLRESDVTPEMVADDIDAYLASRS